eukprot:TRINITY_DN916_c0_g1_i1.p1 TRINITY_DN916_c0_g1~~TRINITY_DN916_c0_g1_i1.p1  ORF type:complete len:507 (+),score=128.17 TRINITY_DN916_c0_g1_i1:1746-3266(+)
MPLTETFVVNSPQVRYDEDKIVASSTYVTTEARVENGTTVVTPISKSVQTSTLRKVPKTGVMIVGLGGNNGTTFVAGIIANREGISWKTTKGVRTPNYYGSITQSSTVRLAEGFYVPFRSLLPMLSPNDMVVGGWDISSMNLADAMGRAEVLDYDLQRQLIPHMRHITPLPSIYNPDFIAANQGERADNLLQGTLRQKMDAIRQQIRDFKANNGLDKVIVLWSANTERFCDLQPGVHDTAENLLKAIDAEHSEVSPSTVFACASILEGCAFINGSPQNTLVPGVVELALRHKVMIGGDDFKTGQTKFKSALVEFLVGSGIKPVAITSYNHLGNNDGRNLSSYKQFRSKEISKSNVVDDMVGSNRILYKEGEHPDHTVVIKYVPYVGDSKRALDEYVSEIFLGGLNTISVHNTCEDSLLATPIMYDLIILTEIAQRMSFTVDGVPMEWHSVLSLLSFLLKAPMVPDETPVVNALNKQRAAIENIFRAAVGLPVESNMLLEYKLTPSK